MKLATWNIERLKHKSKLVEIADTIKAINPDILILTETDCQIKPDYRYCFSTPKTVNIAPSLYKETENRVSIYTNYELIRQYETYDEYTALCVELETERGHLIVYGTIIGFFGNRHRNFTDDLSKQVADIERLSTNQNLCVAGDFNISFADNYYFTQSGRETLNETFEKTGIEILTRNRPECIDHIAISKKVIGNSTLEIKEWNYNKRLSDHKGIWVDVRNFDMEQI